MRRAVVMALSALALLGSAPRFAARAAAPAPQGIDPAPQGIDIAMLAPSSLLWLHAVAMQEGFYAKHGLRVHELRVSDSPALLEAVASGSAAAGFSLGDLAMRAIDRGAPIVIAGAVLDKAVLRLYAAKGIGSVAGLDGKNVTAGAVRGGTADLLRYLLKEGGADLSDIHLVSIANSRDRIVALEKGALSGALLIPPLDTLAERAGAKDLGAYADPYLETPLIFNKRWAAGHRATALALTQALREAAAWMNDPKNRAASVAALAAYTKVPTDVCQDSYDFMIVRQHAVPADLEVSAQSLQDIEAIDAAVNGSAADWPKFSLSRYYDPSFLRAR